MLLPHCLESLSPVWGLKHVAELWVVVVLLVDGIFHHAASWLYLSAAHHTILANALPSCFVLNRPRDDTACAITR